MGSKLKAMTQWTWTRWGKLALVMGLATSSSACGGQLDPTPVVSDSFSPHDAVTEEGSPASVVWWKYQVNGGEEVPLDQGGLPLGVDFNDVTIALDTAARQRTVDLSGRMSGNVYGTVVSGTYAVQVVERFEGGATTRILDQSMEMDMSMTAEGQTVRLEVAALATPATPWEWFLDRADLDQVPVGMAHTEATTVTVTGQTRVVVSGYGEQSEAINQSAASEDTWTVLGTLPSVNVLGVDYANVVQVERSTVAPNAQTGAVEPTNIYYEVARGIGIVRVEGWFTVGTTPLLMELRETNLVREF